MIIPLRFGETGAEAKENLGLDASEVTDGQVEVGRDLFFFTAQRQNQEKSVSHLRQVLNYLYRTAC